MASPPILPLLFKLSPLWFGFGCGYFFFRGLAARNFIAGDRRVAWAFTVLLMGILFVLIAEIAGALRQLTRGTVLTMWLIADAALLAAVIRFRKPTREDIITGVKGGWKRFPALLAGGRSASPWNAALFILASAMILLVGAIALQCPTNVWDSLTYHVPRVMHWLQQRNLSHYPTNIVRQLESAPGAELQVSTLALLTGDDWAFNLPQWSALLTCGLLASLLAERFLTWHFGREPLDQPRVRWCGLFAALIAVTVAPGMTQAISTQNDFLSAQWLTLLAVFGLLLVQEPKNYFYGAGAAAALTLGVNNKATMFIYAAPFAAALGLWLARRSWRMLAALGLAAAVLVPAANLPWMARNEAVFHHPLGSQETLRNHPLQDHSPSKMAANLVRNMALYADTPFTWSTSALNHVLSSLFNLVGEPPQDEGSIWLGEHFMFASNSTVKSGGGFGGLMTPLPLLLAMLFFLAKFKWKSPLLIYPGLLLAGFALFCGYLRWQPWHERLHLPFFILAAPFAGMVLGWVWNRWLVLAASLLLVLNALLVLGYNHDYPVFMLSQGPLQTREERYFPERPELYAGLAEMARDVVASGVTNVCLKIPADTWEYPFWVCLKNRGFQGTIQHVFVDNESARLGAPDLDLPGTAILSLAEPKIPPPADFGLRIGYDRWAAYYRGKPESRERLVSNHLLIKVNFPQSSLLQIRCNPIDQHGQPVTNNVLRLQVGEYARDFSTASGEVILEWLFTPGTRLFDIFCLHPLSTDQRSMTLANWEVRVTPAAPSPGVAP